MELEILQRIALTEPGSVIEIACTSARGAKLLFETCKKDLVQGVSKVHIAQMMLEYKNSSFIRFRAYESLEDCQNELLRDYLYIFDNSNQDILLELSSRTRRVVILVKT